MSIDNEDRLYIASTTCKRCGNPARAVVPSTNGHDIMCKSCNAPTYATTEEVGVFGGDDE